MNETSTPGLNAGHATILIARNRLISTAEYICPVFCGMAAIRYRRNTPRRDPVCRRPIYPDIIPENLDVSPPIMPPYI